MRCRLIAGTVVLLLMAACSGDAAPAGSTSTASTASTTPPSDSSTTGATSTTLGPPPESSVATTITLPGRVTVVTTMPLVITTVSLPGRVTVVTTVPFYLPPVAFDPDGIGFASFGDDPGTVIARAESLWGPADDDSGSMPSAPDFCPGSAYRRVTWALPGTSELFLLFTDDTPWSTPGGALRFSGYGYTSPTKTTLTSGQPVSIDVWDLVAEVKAMWPYVQVFESEFDGVAMFQYSPDGYNSGVVLMGRLTGLANTDRVVDIYGGNTCYGDAPGLD